MDQIKELLRVWHDLPWYQDPVIITLSLMMAVGLILMWVGRRGGRRGLRMTRQQWTAHKTKEKAKRKKREYDSFHRYVAEQQERKIAKRKAKETRARGSLEVPTHLQTNPSVLPPNPSKGVASDGRPRVIHEAVVPPRDAGSVDLPTLPDGYRDFKILGSGGFADVMFARKLNGTPVAIKTLRHTTGDRGIRERWFRREVRMLSELTSPAIPRLIEQRLDIPHPYFVMEYIHGHNLADYIAKNGPFRNMQLVSNLAIYTASAIYEMHGKGFIHRDIKPANVMVTPNGQFRLIDLGIGKDTGSESTASQVTAGTLAFSPPESVTEGNTGAMADIFSWGATIGYAMTGRKPYGDASGSALLLKVMKGEIDPAFLASVEEAGRNDGSTIGPLLARVVAVSVRGDPSLRSTEYLKLLSRNVK